MSEMDPQEQQPLNYLPPQEDRAMLAERRNQRAAGAVISCIVALLTVVFYILSTLQFHPTGPLPWRAKMAALMEPLAALGLLSVVTLYQHFVRGRRWFFQGVLIGLGIAALIEGVCFGILKV